MTPQNQKKLEERIGAAGEAALAKRKVVTPIDMLVGIGWLTAAQVERWRRGQIPYLERVTTANLPKLATALRLLRRWAERRGLKPSETDYRHRSQRLRFSRFGDENVERAYRTHWISAEPSRKSPTVILTNQDGG